MKKLFALILALTLTLPTLGAADCGCGCGACICGEEARDTVLIAKSETAVRAGYYAGSSWWALTAWHRVPGKIQPNEDVDALPANPPESAWIGGCVDNGLVREHSVMEVITSGGAVYGLAKVDVKIQIKDEYVPLVESIVRERLEVDTITANAIIAATMWWQENTVCHIFFLPGAPKMQVGTVTVNNGKAAITLWAGDFDGDGALELGFVTGSAPAATPEPVATPEPEPEATPAPRTETRQECAAQKTIVKNVYITNVVQINIASKATQVVNVGKTGCKPCLPKCLAE